SYPAEIWGDYMRAALSGLPSVPFPAPDYSLIPGGQPIGAPPSPTSVPTSTPSSTTSTAPTSIPGATVPRPDITRPPRPTFTTPTRPPPTRTTRCYINPRTSSTVCR